MRKIIFLLPLILIAAQITFTTAQEIEIPFNIEYKVSKVFPPLSLTKEKLQNAKTVEDLNIYYKESWVERYESVTISAYNNGSLKTATSADNNLTDAQRNIILLADPATEIAVNVDYMPKNTLRNNKQKNIKFSFIQDPERDAEFPGGNKALEKYLYESAESIIPESDFNQYEVAAIEFAIDETGQVVEAGIHNMEAYTKESKKERDTILLNAICNMPKWKPAQYATGLKVKTNYVFTAGDHNSCTVNFFNVKNNPLLTQ